MNFNTFDPEGLFNTAHIAGQAPMSSTSSGVKRSAHDVEFDKESMPHDNMDLYRRKEESHGPIRHQIQGNADHSRSLHGSKASLSNGKKTKGRVKIKMEFIDNKLRRYTTFSKRKTGIMKKAYELSTLTGTQVMLLVASETGHVYTFATRKLQPMITSQSGKALIQTCLNSPDPPSNLGTIPTNNDQRMSATGYEETELTYAVRDDDEPKSPSINGDFVNGNTSGTDSELEGISPCASPGQLDQLPSTMAETVPSSSDSSHIPSSLLFASNGPDNVNTSQPEVLENSKCYVVPSMSSTTSSSPSQFYVVAKHLSSSSKSNSNDMDNHSSGGTVMMGTPGGNLMYSSAGGLVYTSQHQSSSDNRINLPDSTSLIVNLSPEFQQMADNTQGNGNVPQVMAIPMSLASSLQSTSTPGTRTIFQSLPTDLSMPVKKERR